MKSTVKFSITLDGCEVYCITIPRQSYWIFSDRIAKAAASLKRDHLHEEVKTLIEFIYE